MPGMLLDLTEDQQDVPGALRAIAGTHPSATYDKSVVKRTRATTIATSANSTPPSAMAISSTGEAEDGAR